MEYSAEILKCRNIQYQQAPSTDVSYTCIKE